MRAENQKITTHLSTVFKCQPEREVATSLGVFRIRQDDSTFGSPVQSSTHATDDSSKNNEPSGGH